MAEYEVEKILDTLEIHPGEILYLVKWKNYDYEYNTYEPIENLDNCRKSLSEFSEKGPDKNRNEFDKIEIYLLQHTKEEEDKILKKYRTSNGTIGKIDKPDYELIDSTISKFTENKSLLYDLEAVKKAKFLLLSKLIYNKRNQQLTDISQKEKMINDISPPHAAELKIENKYDLDKFPTNFTYINENVPREGVIVNNEPILWCTCLSNCASNKDDCCWYLNNSDPAYSKRTKRIQVEKGTAVYECNKNCACDESCHNRVVQKGITVPMTIFKTANGRGWGVKTQERIKSGTFVCEYVGEILTHETSLARLDGAYTFNLDFNCDREECLYVIDAKLYGNVSHFFNHSCVPNLEVYAVYVDEINPDLHRVALFAKRDIARNEELTFCYFDISAKSGRGRKKFAKKECLCSSKDCLGYYYLTT